MLVETFYCVSVNPDFYKRQDSVNDAANCTWTLTGTYELNINSGKTLQRKQIKNLFRVLERTGLKVICLQL